MPSSSRNRVTALPAALSGNILAGRIRSTPDPCAPGRGAGKTLFIVSMLAIGCLGASPWREASAQGFGAKTDFTTGNNPYSVAIGDLNGDGKPDLAVANYNSSTVSVLLGTGGGSFGPKTDFATGSNPFSVAIGDLNGDGRPDLAVANINAQTVSVLLGIGGGSFGPKTDFATGTSPNSV